MGIAVGTTALVRDDDARVRVLRGNLPKTQVQAANLGHPASRGTLQKAGFVPCGALIVGDLAE